MYYVLKFHKLLVFFYPFTRTTRRELPLKCHIFSKRHTANVDFKNCHHFGWCDCSSLSGHWRAALPSVTTRQALRTGFWQYQGDTHGSRVCTVCRFWTQGLGFPAGKWFIRIISRERCHIWSVETALSSSALNCSVREEQQGESTLTHPLSLPSQMVQVKQESNFSFL